MSTDLKIVTLGPLGVGKTCVIQRFCCNVFVEGNLSTIGAAFFSRNVKNSDIDAALMIWDTAGEERFKSVAPTILRGADGVVLVFDTQRPETFEELEDYIALMTNSIPTDLRVPVMVLGNKVDIGPSMIEKERIEQWTEKHDIQLYFEVSAKTGSGVEDAFMTLTKDIIETAKQTPVFPAKFVTDEVPKKGKCC